MRYKPARLQPVGDSMSKDKLLNLLISSLPALAVIAILLFG